MKEKPKFDKRRCASCKYHGTGHHGYSVKINRTVHRDTSIGIFCDYAGKNKEGLTCLHREPDGAITDRRGCDPKHCALYEKGNTVDTRFDNNYVFVD